MGRSRSTPGLNDSKSQLNIVSGPSAGDKKGEHLQEEDEGSSPPPSPHPGVTVSSQRMPPPPHYSSIAHSGTSYYSAAQTDSVTITMPSSTPVKLGSPSDSRDTMIKRTTSPERSRTISPTQYLTPQIPPPLPRTPVPGEVSQETLIQEIKRLRDKLLTVESENLNMTRRLSQQHTLVESRLKEIETQMISSERCGGLSGTVSSSSMSSAGTVLARRRDEEEEEDLHEGFEPTAASSASSPTSGEDSERNKESII